MAVSTLEKTNVFQFMVIRGPESPEPAALQRGYIRDDDDLFSAKSKSSVGPMIYRKVFCEELPGALPASRAADGIIDALLETLPFFFEPLCPSPADHYALTALGDRPYLVANGRFYVLPDRLQSVNSGLVQNALTHIVRTLRAPPLAADGSLDLNALLTKLRQLFDDRALRDVVLNGGEQYSEEFADAKRQLFDTLYALYILRRRVSVTLEHIIDGLRALHLLQALALDPARLASLDALQAYMAATPIIHPLFARLHRFRTPFNNLRPLGLGDLKVVKQWLCGYKAGDFAHVENVLEGETKVRVHRRLEKTQESFSYSNEKQEETQRDTQSTDRFELSREAESVVKQDLAVNANAAVTYTYGGGMIVANVTAGVAYTRSQTDQNKSADNLSREVLDKAVKRIQSRVSEQRSTTKIFETEETNTHTLTGPIGKGHTSGIYRWLDKEYRAQLFNYGKRLMFEFILPEPAAFFVEARLRAYEGQIDVPKPPVRVNAAAVALEFEVSELDEDLFNTLRLRYDLADLSYPLLYKTVNFKDLTTGQAFIEGGTALPKTWISKSYPCDLRAKGYDIIALVVDGTLGFSSVGSDKSGAANQLHLRNLFAISIDGVQLFYANYDGGEYHSFHTPNNESLDAGLHQFPPHELTEDKVDLVIGSQNALFYHLEVSARLRLSDRALAKWKQSVYERVYKAEQDRLDEVHQAAKQAYQARLATYHNRLGELRAVAVNELLQGQSDSFNRQLIATELKRLCLASLTKDFDADPADDVATTLDAMGKRDVKYTYRQLDVKELPDAIEPSSVEVAFAVLDKSIGYPAPQLGVAAIKARYVQFLEQAFEWQQLAYLFYPYFWASPPRWIELMSRVDSGDPNMSAFLQAGSCKVVLAVAPAYNDAVMHYLATGEPWEGGPAPVIGDPLYVPLYEELRRQQDDLEGAKPEGTSWSFTVPTSLVYLENSSTPLPKSVCEA